MRALKQLGVLDQCLAEGAGGSEMQLFNVDGELLQTLQIHGLLGPDYPSRLDRRIEGQEVRLLGDRGDRAHDLADLP